MVSPRTGLILIGLVLFVSFPTARFLVFAPPDGQYGGFGKLHSATRCWGNLLKWNCVRGDVTSGQPPAPFFKEAWVIGLNSSARRWKQVQRRLSEEGLLANRWVALPKGEDVTPELMEAENVHWSPSLSHLINETTTKRLIAATLSHRSLLRMLANLPASDSEAHLVLEDDAVVLANFRDEWSNASSRVPADWDAVFFGLIFREGKEISEGVWKMTLGGRNSGSFSYAVRHGALRSKILPYLQEIYMPIDDMLTADCLRNCFSVYYLEPSLCAHGLHGSNILNVEY